jgi:outer membrane lipase/esterase
MKIKLAVLAFSVFCASQAAAGTFDAFFAFGDSTVDSGWWSGALSGQCDGAPSPCTTGSANKDTLISNAIANGGTGAPVGVGLMNTQILASDFGLTAKPANQTGGTNYAISGALSAVTAGIGNLNPNGTLPSTVGQMTNYLGAHVNTADPSALYLISSGGNDITYAQTNFTTLAAKETYLANQASALAAQIAVLQSDGAKNIVVYGSQGSGTLPTYFTNQLFADLAAKSVKFIGADIAGMIAAVEADPTLYGFTAATVFPGIVGTGTGSACATQTGAGAITSGWGQWCANKTTASTLYASLTSANSELTSFFSDDQHLSAAGQLIEANYVYSLIVTPLPAALPLFASGLGALGLLGWRRKRKAAALAA